MQIAPQDRPKVKAECLRLLATLRLDPARTQLISGFVDTYLRLNATEEQVFGRELDSMGLIEEEQVMEIVTSWMETGMQRGTQKLVLRLLNRRLGTLEPSLLQRVSELPLEQLEALGEDLLDFTEISDLVNWLNQPGGTSLDRKSAIGFAAAFARSLVLQLLHLLLAAPNASNSKICWRRLCVSSRCDRYRTACTEGCESSFCEVFGRELDSMGLIEEEQVMEIVTSWMETPNAKAGAAAVKLSVGNT